MFDVGDGQKLDRGLEIRQLSSRHQPAGVVSARCHAAWPTATGWRLYRDGVSVRTLHEANVLSDRRRRSLSARRSSRSTRGWYRGFSPLDQNRSVHRRGHGNDLYNLRLYQAGDDSRQIHWPTTARTSQLTVRETEAEDQRRAIVYLPTVAPLSHDALFEQAVSLTASIVQHLAHRGYMLQLLMESSRSSFGQGDLHLAELASTCSPSVNGARPSPSPLCRKNCPNDSLEDEGRTMIVVQSWRGPGDIQPEQPHHSD